MLVPCRNRGGQGGRRSIWGRGWTSSYGFIELNLWAKIRKNLEKS